jgi:hypothetical protein
MKLPIDFKGGAGTCCDAFGPSTATTRLMPTLATVGRIARDFPVNRSRPVVLNRSKLKRVPHGR